MTSASRSTQHPALPVTLCCWVVVAVSTPLIAQEAEPGPPQAFNGNIALTNPQVDAAAETFTSRIKFSGTVQTQEDAVESATLITSKLSPEKMTSKSIIAAAAAAVVPPIDNLGGLQLVWESAPEAISLRLRRSGNDPVDVQVPETVMQLILPGGADEFVGNMRDNARDGSLERGLVTWRVKLFEDQDSTTALDLRGVGPVSLSARRGLVGRARLSGFNTGEPVVIDPR